VRVNRYGGYGGYYSGSYYSYSSGYGIPSASFIYPSGGTAAADDQVPFFVMSGRDTRIEYVGGQWAMRTVALERTLGKEVGQISPSLRLEENRVVGSIRNDTSFFLEDAAILTGPSVVKLGSLAPGQTAPVVVDLSDVSDTSNAYPGSSYRPLSYRLLDTVSSSDDSQGTASGPGPYRGFSSGPVPMVYSGRGTPGGERWEMPKDPETARRARLADAISQPTGPYNSGLAASQPLTLVAFTRSPLGIALPSAGTHPLYTLSLVEQRLRLDAQPGVFRLPSALSPGEYVAEASKPPTPSTGMPTMTATYRYRPPLPRGATIDALEFSLPATSAGSPYQSPFALPSSPPGGPGQAAPGPAPDSTVALYNWRSGGWDPLPDGQEGVRIEPADAYVSADGEIRVQLNSAPYRGPGGQSMPELVIEGNVHS
jgi:hypothetical protein